MNLNNVLQSLLILLFTPLFIQAQSTPVSISEARSQGLGSTITTTGWISTDNTVNSHIYIQDGTAGIAIFSADLASATVFGDSVVVSGTLSQFGQTPFPGGQTDGFLRISGTVTFEVFSQGRQVQEPITVTIADLNSGAFESQLVVVSQTPIFSTGTNNYISGNLQGGSEYAIRILEDTGRLFIANDTETAGISAPQTEVDITGIVARFRGNYRLTPRSATDITENPFTFPDADRTLDVMTWNIEWFGSTSNGPSNVEVQFQNVKRIIEETQMDIIAMQEIADENLFQRLINELDGYRGFISPRAFSSQNQRIAFFFNTNTIDSIASANVATAGSWGQRNPLEFTFDFTPVGSSESRRIKATNLHAKAFSTLADYNTRVSDANILKQYADATNRDNKLIILGDYNDDVTVATFEGRTSPYEIFNVDSRYNIVTRVLSLAGLTSFRDRSMIDHIMINEKLFDYHLDRAQDVFDPTPYVTNYLGTTSDHFPVITRFYFPTGTRAPEFDSEIPSHISLDQNFPNPFNPSTTIRFSLNSNETVSLRVFDITGRTVATLLQNDQRSAGNHEVRFDGSSLASGIYIYTLTTGSGLRLTQKMMLIK
jgi:endonuclease/exonuclease/phosphatase family metal-dependent hydrolase